MSFFPPVAIDAVVVRELTNIKRMSDIHGSSASVENLKRYLEQTSDDVAKAMDVIEMDYTPTPASTFSPK